MYPLHQNDTGSFQELAHVSDIKFGQLSVLTVEPRRKRGGHYHTHKREWFCCLHGACYLVSTDVRNQKPMNFALRGDHREFIEVRPYEAHTVLNPSDQACELLVISSEEYDPSNPDTITYDRAKETI